MEVGEYMGLSVTMVRCRGSRSTYRTTITAVAFDIRSSMEND